MGVITKIEVQKKNKDRVNIYIDNEFFTGLDLELIYTLKLDKGSMVDDNKLKEIISKDNFSKAKSKALRILNKAEQSEKVLRDKLSDFDEDTVNEVIEYMKDSRYLDDKGLAKRIAYSNSNISRFGKNKIKQNLYKKGIDRDSIEEAISDIDEDVEFENALYLGQKRYRSIKNEDKNKIYQKLSQHLIYKGFSYDITKKVISTILNDIDYYED